MNRHHPYGGYDDARRRSQSPPGFGPGRTRYDRGSNRGGRGRGRGGPGGYSSYGQQSAEYDSFDHSGFNHHHFASSGFGQEQSFTSNPGNNGSTYAGQDGPGSRNRPLPRRERDDKIHDNLIEERIQRERPCRTLFIRNIKYETDSNDVRRRFEEHGEIKTFFDLISNRGMVFVTYFDLRAAERARERLQGTDIAGRPIDVHYSLPRADEQSGRCDRDKNQGTLLVTLRDSHTHQHIDDLEIRRKFQQFGDVKSVRSLSGRSDQRHVEMYDTRACEEAHDRLRHQGLQDGVMDISFAWDVPDLPVPPGPVPLRRTEDYPGVSDGYGRDFEDNRPRDRGFRGRGRGRGRGMPDAESEHRGPPRSAPDDWGRRHERPRFEDDLTRSSRVGNGREFGVGSEDRHPARNDGGYGPAPSNYGSSMPAVSSGSDDRLEQARKVQQLLAALKAPQGSGASAPASPQPLGPTHYYPPPVSYGSVSQQGAPQSPYPTLPTSLANSAVPTIHNQSSASSNQALLSAIPPNVLALLQQNPSLLAQATPQSLAQAVTSHTTDTLGLPYTTSVPQVNLSQQSQSPAAVQNLLALLAQQQQKQG